MHKTRRILAIFISKESSQNKDSGMFNRFTKEATVWLESGLEARGMGLSDLLALATASSDLVQVLLVTTSRRRWQWRRAEEKLETAAVAI